MNGVDLEQIAVAFLVRLLKHPDVVSAVRGLSAPAPAVEEADALFNKGALAKKLSVSVATIDRMAAEGMPHSYVGDARRFDLGECRAWLGARGKRPTKARRSEAEIDVSDVLAGAGLRPST